MRSAGTLPSAGSFVLLRLIVMPLDGEEHARAQDDNLERKDDYGEQVYPIQIHHFEYFQAVTRHYRYDERYLKTDASTTSIQALMQCLLTQPNRLVSSGAACSCYSETNCCHGNDTADAFDSAAACLSPCRKASSWAKETVRKSGDLHATSCPVKALS